MLTAFCAKTVVPAWMKHYFALSFQANYTHSPCLHSHF